MATKSFIHSGNIGDVWASIPAMNEYYNKTGNKVVLYLVNGQRAIYYEGATHPTKDELGEHVMLNENMINMMIPLLKVQPFIEDVKIWNDEKADISLDRIRDTYVGMPNFSINRWYFYIYPDLACDLSKIWLTVTDADEKSPVYFVKDKILISRSERYANTNINYMFLKRHESYLMFIGLKHERDIFCAEYGLDIPLLIVNNFLELSQAIKLCRFHISNQTMAFQISEGLKKPRILELCQFAPNVIPIGEDAYDFFAQVALEGYVKMLNEKYPPYIKKEGKLLMHNYT